MDPSNKCPRCGAALEPRVRGDLEDKILACKYCGYTAEVADDYQETRTEEKVFPDGTRSRITVARKRSDAPPNLSSPGKASRAGDLLMAAAPKSGLHFGTSVSGRTKTFSMTFNTDFKSGKSPAPPAEFAAAMRRFADQGQPIQVPSQEAADQIKSMLPADLAAKLKFELGTGKDFTSRVVEKTFFTTNPEEAGKFLRETMGDRALAEFTSQRTAARPPKILEIKPASPMSGIVKFLVVAGALALIGFLFHLFAG